MLKIRLTRTGKNRHASFRVVVTEHTNPVKGKFLELLGSYNPHAEGAAKLSVKADRLKYWMSKGVQASPTVHNLLIDLKIIEGKKKESWKAPKKEVKPEEVAKVVVAPVTPEAPATEVAAPVVKEEKPATEPVAVKEEEKPAAPKEEEKSAEAPAVEEKPVA
jgi:small subunit ribosomal protein S16